MESDARPFRLRGDDGRIYILFQSAGGSPPSDLHAKKKPGDQFLHLIMKDVGMMFGERLYGLGNSRDGEVSGWQGSSAR
jgi:hypothetical protein